MEQGTEEWRLARAGSLGASQVADAIAKTKTGWGASRANVMATLLCERLTGQPQESYSNAAMVWGLETEPQARAAYTLYTGHSVETIGLVRHLAIAGTHASPDGLVGDTGLLELKCPNTATHLETILTGSIPGKYITQMQWQMACAGRAWCDFASFDPRLPERMRLWVKRIERDEDMIAELESEVRLFLLELQAKYDALILKYGNEATA